MKSQEESKLPIDYKLSTFKNLEEPELLDQIARLRLKVWRATGFKMVFDLQGDLWLDEKDKCSCHFAIVKGINVIAASRLTIYNSIADSDYAEWFQGIYEQPIPLIAFISKLVVEPEHQHRGLGKFLDNACIKLAKDLSAKSVLCDVPEYRINPLIKMGFKLIQEPKLGIMFPTVKWCAMLLKLE